MREKSFNYQHYFKRCQLSTIQELFLPEKNCTISSLLQPKGRPRNRTSPSPAVSGQFGPVCFMTQSISTLLDLNTISQNAKQQLPQLKAETNTVINKRVIICKRLHTPSTYLWPIVSLSFFTAIFKSSSVSNSTNASPLGRPSLVYVKWMPPPLLTILQSVLENDYHQIICSHFNCRGITWKTEINIYVPEKNLCTSSTEQDQGRPLMRTTYPSSAMTGHSAWWRKSQELYSNQK